MNIETAQKMIQLFETDIKIYQTLISKCTEDEKNLIDCYNEKINTIEKSIAQLNDKIKMEKNQNGCY